MTRIFANAGDEWDQETQDILDSEENDPDYENELIAIKELIAYFSILFKANKKKYLLFTN